MERDDVHADVAQLTVRRCCLALRFMRTSNAGSGGRREELERYAVWITEGDSRAVVGVLDPAVRDAQLIQARGPGLQLTAVTAGEGNMIQAGTTLIEPVTCGLRVRVQAEQLPAAEREYGVVKSSGLLVLVENGLGAQQPAVPASASLQISHRHSDVGDRRELRHSGLLTDGATCARLPRSHARLLLAGTPA
jgi:hypothetical protein